MRKTTKILAGVLVVVAGGWFAGCNSTIDKEPDVVLEVENLQIPVVTASQDSVNNTCTFTISPANATFKNKPKNQYAGVSPFNDIILKNVNVSYFWDDAATAPDRIIGLGGSVPADGSATGQFTVVANADLATICPTPECRSGHTATLSMTFNGVTVSGDDVSVTTGGTLQVNSCTAAAFGACCTGGAGCSDILQTDCQAIPGAVFQGNNTTCSLTNCNLP